MKKCPAIVGLSFDEESKRGISERNFREEFQRLMRYMISQK